jgi:hypothetical protein
MASGQSRIGVWNAALDLLKENPLASIDDALTDSVGKWLQRNYDQRRDYMLGRYWWKFAMTRVELASAGTPAWGWSNKFALPADCIRFVPPTYSGEWNGIPIPFEEEGGEILCDKDGALRLRYVRRVQEEGLWSNDFCEVMAQSLAYSMAHWLTGKQSMVQQLGQQLEATIAEVRKVGGMQTAPESYYDSNILDERSSY